MKCTSEMEFHQQKPGFQTESDAHTDACSRQRFIAKCDGRGPVGDTGSLMKSGQEGGQEVEYDHQESVEQHQRQQIEDDRTRPRRYKWQVVWINVIYYTILHLLAVWGLYSVFFTAHIATSLSALFYYILGGIGVTAGCHRLWSHRTYRATWQLRTLLMLMFTMAGQNDIYEWSRDHRLHHRKSETEADPHNAKRGFFFAHMGWLLVRKQKSVLREGRKISMVDIEADPVVRFNRRFYLPLMLMMNIVLPMWTARFGWNENLLASFLVCGVLKYVVTLHATWLVNSLAHISGNKPYDRDISPAENRSVALFAVGEGWHNYHHVFPWDYKAAELPGGPLNITTLFIDFFALIGWVYDRKTVSEEVIDRKSAKSGDGTRKKTA